MTAAALSRPPDRVLLGVALMLGFLATAPWIDAFSKLAAQTLPVGQVTAARFLVQAALTLPLALAAGEGLGLPRGAVGAVVLRGFCLFLSTFAFVSAVDVMPLADALAIVFVMPFLLLLLGRWWFGDAVGPRRILACLVGFGGSLLVIQPSFAAFGAVALWPLVTALSFAVYMLVTRGLAGRMRPGPMQLHTSLAALLFCLPPLVLGEGTGSATWDAAWPGGREALLLIGVGVASTVSHLAMTWALRFAPSATLAPLNYLELVVTVTLGYAIFGDFPDALTWVGIAVIAGSGLAVVALERASAARAGAPGRPGGAPGAAG